MILDCYQFYLWSVGELRIPKPLVIEHLRKMKGEENE